MILSVFCPFPYHLAILSTWDLQGKFSNQKRLMAYFHCRTQIRTRARILDPMAAWYYAEHVCTDSDSDLDPFPIVFV